MALPDRLTAALGPRYELGREIGRGGMSTVYLAHDRDREAPVAIKVLRMELIGTRHEERFLREIRIASSLDHPNILPIHDWGSAPGALWYVMPYVPEGTLRDRLRKEHQLSFDDAIRITSEIGSALSHAHAHGVIHRDVKPANVLLRDGTAVVSDFGVAHALSELGPERLTSSGFVLGTPEYVSPEQAEGDRNLDGRTDIYSLGCIVYELLAGEPPYTGPTQQSVFAKHLASPVPDVVLMRRTVPPGVARAVSRSLAKTPTDRFQTVEAFVEALAAGAKPGAIERRWGGRRVGLVASLGIVIALALWAGYQAALAAGVIGTVPGGDPSTYLLFPLQYDQPTASFNGNDLLERGLSYWSDLTVADPFDVSARFKDIDGASVSPAEAAKLARSVGAGRYVRGSVVSGADDSIFVRLTLYDAARDGERVSSAAGAVSPSSADAPRQIETLVDALLFDSLLVSQDVPREGTHSYAARRAFARGTLALRSWNLSIADAAFARALQLDASYVQAKLWTAMVRAWSGAETTKWSLQAASALKAANTLPERERLFAEAIGAQATGDWGAACNAWERATQSYKGDPNAWFGLGFCRSEDPKVVHDAASQSGWAFRSSYHQAVEAYRTAYELNPSMLAAFRLTSYERSPILAYTTGTDLRYGKSDSLEFRASVSIQGDSLSFVPYPVGVPRPVAGRAAAVLRQRKQFNEIAATWASNAPQDAYAVEALAMSLALLGDAEGLDELSRARTLARDPADRLRMSAIAVWMNLSFGLPSDSIRISRASAIADSIIANAASSEGLNEPGIISSVAALTGRVDRAAHLLDAAPASQTLDPALREAAPALLLYALMGGPLDSLQAFERRARTALDPTNPSRAGRTPNGSWLARAASLAFPSTSELARADLRGRNALLDLQLALMDGDTAAVKDSLHARAIRRDRTSPADRTPDTLYPEAALLFALGDNVGAIRVLDPTLAVLRDMPFNVLGDPIRGGAALVQAIALRARLAESVGDTGTAARYARTVLILWSDADPFLHPTIAELKRLAGS